MHFLMYENSTCSIHLSHPGCELFGGNGLQCKKPQISHKENRIYEFIYNLEKHQFIIKLEDEIEILLFKQIKGPLYPFIIPYGSNSVDIIDYFKE